MFGRKAQRIEELTESLGNTNDSLTKLRDFVCQIRKELDIENSPGVSTVEAIRSLKDSARENETLLIGAARIIKAVEEHYAKQSVIPARPVPEVKKAAKKKKISKKA